MNQHMKKLDEMINDSSGGNLLSDEELNAIRWAVAMINSMAECLAEDNDESVEFILASHESFFDEWRNDDTND